MLLYERQAPQGNLVVCLARSILCDQDIFYDPVVVIRHASSFSFPFNSPNGGVPALFRANLPLVRGNLELRSGS